MSTENNSSPQRPELPLQDGEVKKLALGFRKVDGKIEVTATSVGMHDDINEIALFLDFALEKILES